MADEPQPQPAETPEPEFKAITSQGELERILGHRLREERERATKPYADYDDLKAKAAQLDELQAASQTDLEKALARADAAEKARDEHAKAISDVEAERREERLRYAILGEAAKADRRVVDPEAVIALLDRSSLELDEQGLPTNIAQAMDSLLTQRPYLVAAKEAAGTRGSADQGARQSGGPKQVTEAELKTMRPEQISQARKEGRLNDLLGVR